MAQIILLVPQPASPVLYLKGRASSGVIVAQLNRRRQKGEENTSSEKAHPNDKGKNTFNSQSSYQRRKASGWHCMEAPKKTEYVCALGMLGRERGR
mmetsp:Transcript_9827/g.21287  ORF Transcript_9827/g.21287 Transcript_9827/m.21287 type:complete len:96 (+) Transcript_9827:246-533(+)